MHLKETESTQKHLLKLIESNSNLNVLVSTEKQTKGKGRNENKWHQCTNSLAFSFTLNPCKSPTLTPLEIGVQICQFLKPNKLSLKWPNDLLTHNKKKCGGIICNYVAPGLVVVGVGLNWGGNSSPIYGKIFDNKILSPAEYKTIPEKIYNYILKNRLAPSTIIHDWNTLCTHMDCDVTIENNKQQFQGIFTGIGQNGEAILDSQKRFLSGSLFMTPKTC